MPLSVDLNTLMEIHFETVNASIELSGAKSRSPTILFESPTYCQLNCCTFADFDNEDCCAYKVTEPTKSRNIIPCTILFTFVPAAKPKLKYFINFFYYVFSLH